MTYLAFYRKYRPQTFQEIIGQEHVARTLQNAVKDNRVAHAYLFTGPRGTGKTTSAKVLAKAVNCLQGPGPEPCNECAVCKAITGGMAVDVAEIDAASNRGIDEIRDLREKVQFAPSTGRYRVYIIDEVHMLTNEAFNALLKILEEPPEHVIFILATTEPRKVPLTILSRCQRFDFKRIGIADMISKLEEVAGKAGLTVEEEALRLIAGAAEGGLRDALSILDQASALGGKQVKAGDIYNILGTVRMDVLSQVAGYLAAGESGPALRLIGRMLAEGKDPRLFLSDLAGFLRALLLDGISPGAPSDEYFPAGLPAWAESFGQEQLVYILDILTRAEQDMRRSSLPNIILELAIVKACRLEWRADIDSLDRRLARLEEIVLDCPVSPYGVQSETVAVVPAGEVQHTVMEGRAAALPDREKGAEERKVVTLEEVGSIWPDFIQRVKEERLPLHGNLVKAFPVQVKGKHLVIGFTEDARLAKERAEQKENKKFLEKLLEKTFGGQWRVSCTFKTGEKASETTYTTLAEKALRLFGGEEIETGEGLRLTEKFFNQEDDG